MFISSYPSYHKTLLISWGPHKILENLYFHLELDLLRSWQQWVFGIFWWIWELVCPQNLRCWGPHLSCWDFWEAELKEAHELWQQRGGKRRQFVLLKFFWVQWMIGLPSPARLSLVIELTDWCTLHQSDLHFDTIFAFWCILMHLIFNKLSSLQCLHEDQKIWGGKELKTSR